MFLMKLTHILDMFESVVMPLWFTVSLLNNMPPFLGAFFGDRPICHVGPNIMQVLLWACHCANAATQSSSNMLVEVKRIL